MRLFFALERVKMSEHYGLSTVCIGKEFVKVSPALEREPFVRSLYSRYIGTIRYKETLASMTDVVRVGSVPHIIAAVNWKRCHPPDVP